MKDKNTLITVLIGTLAVVLFGCSGESSPDISETGFYSVVAGQYQHHSFREYGSGSTRRQLPVADFPDMPTLGTGDYMLLYGAAPSGGPMSSSMDVLSYVRAGNDFGSEGEAKTLASLFVQEPQDPIRGNPVLKLTPRDLGGGQHIFFLHHYVGSNGDAYLGLRIETDTVTTEYAENKSTAAGSSDRTSAQLVGKWQHSESPMVFTFNSDGTFRGDSSGGSPAMVGEYRLMSDQIVEITYTEGGADTMRYSFMGNQLTLDDPSGRGRATVFNRAGTGAVKSMEAARVREQVAEGMNLTAAVRAAIVAEYLNSGKAPLNRAAAGMTANASDTRSKYVSGVAVDNGTIIVSYGNEADVRVAGATLALQPYHSVNGSVAWGCGYYRPEGLVPMDAAAPTAVANTTVPADYLPSACRR